MPNGSKDSVKHALVLLCLLFSFVDVISLISCQSVVVIFVLLVRADPNDWLASRLIWHKSSDRSAPR